MWYRTKAGLQGFMIPQECGAWKLTRTSGPSILTPITFPELAWPTSQELREGEKGSDAHPCRNHWGTQPGEAIFRL